MEIITCNGVSYNAEKIITLLNGISFSVTDRTAEEMKTAFKNATTLTVSDQDGQIYGIYENLQYESVTEDAEGIVTITMHIPSKLELQIAQLQASQAEQDEAIAELYGREK